MFGPFSIIISTYTIEMKFMPEQVHACSSSFRTKILKILFASNPKKNSTAPTRAPEGVKVHFQLLKIYGS